MIIRHLILLPVCLLAFACGEPTPEAQETNSAETSLAETTYPENISRVLEAHGGIDAWNSQRTLSYKILRESGDESHTIDLWNRFDKVEMPDAVMGYDGEEVWLVADTSYKRDPVFYHNLMFYFYAMPFVLADDGIVYTDTTAVEFEGVSYPGVKISYESGVGASDKDEYILYYHPETGQMAWLGYTATYFSGKKADSFNWIRYDDWVDVSGVILPKSLTWYKHENGLPIEPRNTVGFAEITLSEEALPIDTFQKPSGV